MPDFRWIHPDFADLVAAQRLDDLDSVLLRNDGEPIMPGHRNRDTLKVEVAGPDGAQQVFYLKREHVVRWKHPLRSLISGQGLWTPARAEFESLTRLAAGGVLCPKPIVCLQHVGVKSRGALLVESLPAGQSLIALLAGPLRDADPARRESFFTRLGREVARLHGCGVSQPHLYANHVYVISPRESTQSEWSIGFVGFRRSLPHACLTLAKRTTDLSALMATLARRLASQRDREAFYDAYLRHSDLEHRGMEVIAGVQLRVERLLTFRKIWEIRESDTDEHRAIRPLESIESGKMWIDRSFRHPLEEAGIANFESMLSTTNGSQLRALADRENWRIELHAPHGEPRGAYLKKHHVRGLNTWLRAAWALARVSRPEGSRPKTSPDSAVAASPP